MYFIHTYTLYVLIQGICSHTLLSCHSLEILAALDLPTSPHCYRYGNNYYLVLSLYMQLNMIW